MAWREYANFGEVVLEKPFRPIFFTKAQKASYPAASYKYYVAVITDGGTGSTPVLVMSDGTNWVGYGAAMTTDLD